MGVLLVLIVVVVVLIVVVVTVFCHLILYSVVCTGSRKGSVVEGNLLFGFRVETLCYCFVVAVLVVCVSML